MSNSIFGIATSGLAAAQAGLLTTSHNIANVNTDGFSRQEVVQNTPAPHYSGAGFLGAGVSVQTVRRAYSAFLELQVRASGAQAAAAEELRMQLAGLEDLLADPAAGLAPALNDFFQGAHDLAAHPADAASRQALIARADALAARFVDLDAQLSRLRAGVNQQIESVVGTINAFAARIAELNRRIVEAGARGAQAQPPNDLLDQRDALLRDLNREIAATAVAQADGTINVFLGSGQAIVVGGNAYALAAAPDPESPQDIAVGVQTGVTLLRLRGADIAGGRLGALLEFREQDLPAVRNALGRIAMSLAAQWNDVHELGQDRTGAPGAAFFAAGSPAAIARSTNAGNAQLGVAIADYSALTASSYRALWDGAAWQVTRLPDGASWSFAALPQTVDGVAISVAAGTPQPGDSFRIEPTAAGAGSFAVLVREPSRIAAAAPIRTASGAANTGSGTVSAGAVNAPPPPNANLAQTVTITFTGAATFDVSGTGTGNPTGLAYTPGAPISFNGWTIEISGAPAAGDRFIVEANAGGVSDNRNMLRLAALQTGRTLEGGSASYADAYGQLAAAIGNRAREAQVSGEALGKLAEQARVAQQSLSGVNLDEEAANLLRYQQAYQAAGKALAIADALFGTLLELGGR